MRIHCVDMPPLTSPGKPLNPVLRRVLLLLAIVLVFSFALHAKLAMYGQSVQPHPSTSSKLWLSSSKLEMLTVPTLPLLVFAAFLTAFLWRAPVWHYRFVRENPAAESRRRQYLHRRLRPPPLQ
jgi:hypothetical protein